MLRTVANHNAQIVSNDQYDAYQDEFDIEERRIPFMIVNGDVELYRPKLK